MGHATRISLVTFCLLMNIRSLQAQASSLSLSSATAGATGTASLNVTLASVPGSEPAALQWNFTYPTASFTAATVSPGASLTGAGKSVTCSSTSTGSICVASGLNASTIPNGVVAVVSLTLAPSASATSVGISNALGATPAGDSAAISATGGSISPSGSSAVLSSLTCAQGSLNANGSTICTITLSAAAPAAGTVVAVASNATALSVPSVVTVAAGATTASFTATAGTLASNQSVSVTATLGAAVKTSTISLTSQLSLVSLACTPSVVPVNGSATCTVQLSSAAPAGGAKVSLSSNNAALVIPPDVTVAAGAASSSFVVTAAASPSTSSATGNSAASASIIAVLGASSLSTSLSLGGSGGTSSAVFVKTDTTTQGNWKSVYGKDGYAIANVGQQYPAYAQVSMAGQTAYTWAASSTDPRGLQNPADNGRSITTYFAANSFTVDVNLADGQSHQVAVYFLDPDTPNGRKESVDVLDSAGTILDTQVVDTFSQGKYLVWNLSGHVVLRFKLLGGLNPVAAGLFFGGAANLPITVSPSSVTLNAGQQQVFTATNPDGGEVTWSLSTQSGTIAPTGRTTATYTAPASLGALTTTTVKATSTADPNRTATAAVTLTPLAVHATFVRADDTTQGNWRNVYGLGGANIAGDTASNPTYAQVSLSGQSVYTWTAEATDARALLKASGAGRIAATYYAGEGFTIDVNITDGKEHEIALYCLDYDELRRGQTIQVVDTATGAVLDTQTVGAFLTGRYLVWNVGGHVTFRVTRTAGVNAVVNGIFIGR